MDSHQHSGLSVPAASEASTAQELSFELLSNAVAHSAAIRIITELQPIGGTGDKIFPPTYEGGEYATERRKVRTDTGIAEVDTVLLDSVQSQANRSQSLRKPNRRLRCYCDIDLIVKCIGRCNHHWRG